MMTIGICAACALLAVLSIFFFREAGIMSFLMLIISVGGIVLRLPVFRNLSGSSIKNANVVFHFCRKLVTCFIKNAFFSLKL